MGKPRRSRALNKGFGQRIRLHCRCTTVLGTAYRVVDEEGWASEDAQQHPMGVLVGDEQLLVQGHAWRARIQLPTTPKDGRPPEATVTR